MPIPEEYVGREQSFAKHLLLKNYLEKLAYHILSWSDELVYVDGFSGPWESNTENFSDTSFAKALEILSKVKRGAEEAFKENKKIRCLFIEKETEPFSQLNKFVQNNKFPTIQAKAIKGEFENLIEDIQNFIGNSFAFIFIDPTGWKGYAYEKIKLLFQQKGEFLINFMFNDINRFIEWDKPGNKESFDALFGYADWKADLDTLYEKHHRRERAILELYCKRLRGISDKIKWGLTYMPISHPKQDRSWFYLIYATTHPRGLQKFHEAEISVLDHYGEIRKEVLHVSKKSKTDQMELFGPDIETPPSFPLDALKRESEEIGRKQILQVVNQKNTIKYSELAFKIMQIPLVNDKLLKIWLQEMRDNGLVEMNGLSPKRKIQDTTLISVKTLQN